MIWPVISDLSGATISHTIQVALAPVFVLVAVGNIMNILSTRMGRIVDRARYLQGRHTETEGREHDLVVIEIRAVDRRIALIARAIRCMVLSALMVGFTVAILFIQLIVRFDVQPIAAGTFFISVALLIVALVLFLRETQVAAASLRIPRDYLELDRKL